MSYTISVDTGGTFTDVIVTDASGAMTIGKSLTTPDRIFDGMRAAITSAADLLSLSFDELLAGTGMLIYGTTRATNAIVTKTVAKTAFVTTEGFADILLLKEGGKFNPHDFSQDYPDPFIPRRWTFEVTERMSSEGTASIPFNEDSARAVAQAIREHGFEAVAVSFLWSIANPAHELKFAEILAEVAPGLPFTLSHQLNPVVREYRRASATAIDASLKPLMQQHLRGLERDLAAAGFTGELLISTTAGGCNFLQALVEKPIYTIGSGPAMAPMAGLNFSTAEGLGDNVIVCDTGGTTFDVGLVRDGAHYPPKGVRGGQDGLNARHWQVGADGSEAELPNIAVITLRKGEIVRGNSTSGGGYGDPLQRDPERVLKDVIDGYETQERAHDAYGVVLRGALADDSLAVDAAATMALRQDRAHG